MPLAALFNRLLTTTPDPNSSEASSTTPEPTPTAPGKSTTAPTAAALFPQPPPPPSSSNDKKDCTHDCAACPSYPRAFEKIGIDTEEPLWGNVKAWRSHLIVATGQDDWIRDVEDIEGSVMAGVKRVVDGGVREKIEKLVDVVSGKGGEKDKDKDKGKKEKKGEGRIMISASNMHVDDDEDGATVVMVPGFEVASGVRETDAEWVVRHLEAGPGCDEPLLSSDSSPPESTSTTTATTPAPPPHITFRPFPHQTLILLCSHRRRDARCGISAPILRKEFERHLSPRGLWRDLTDWREGGVKVLFVNHVGGHKFAANCIVYQKDGNGEVGKGVWLARVKPRDVEGIVGWVLGERGVEEEMVRGGFDRGRGLVSW